MKTDADLIILGGGCAGLSLASRLAGRAPAPRVIVVEPRSRYEEDRTWCGWRLRPHFFADCVIGEWNRWRIITEKSALLLGSAVYPYEMIRASLFYDKASGLLAQSSSAQLLFGSEAVDVLESNSHVTVNLKDGQTLRAPWVVDTRPQARTLKDPWLWQNFVGYVVETGRDTFDQVPTLMEFQSPGNSVAQFMYVIPMGESRFLCECTRFSTVQGEEEELQAELVAWLDKRTAKNWNLERREASSLPMAPPDDYPKNRIVPAGTRGGSMRTSTGYAFHRIQRWADACADAILETGRPIPPARHRLLDAMDHLFLSVLQDGSTSAAELFGDLFGSCPPDRLVRFLSGVPRSSDFWPVVRGLPWMKFIKAMPSLANSGSSS